MNVWHKITQAIDKNLIECRQFNSPLKVMLVSRIRLALFTNERLVKNLAKQGSSEMSMSLENKNKSYSCEFDCMKQLLLV